MKLSVIVPCYNIRGQLGRCLDSILSQTCGDFEVLVVDDGSTDGSGELCDEYAARDARIRVIHQENAGLGPARNTGIDAARGEIFAFIDGDDWILPTMFEKMVGAMERADAQMAVCRYRQTADAEDSFRIADAGEPTGEAVHRDAGDPRILSRDEALRALVEEDERTLVQNAAWNKLYRSELFADADGRERLRYPARRYEDIVITAKLIARCERVAYIDEALYAYVTDRQDSIMNRSRLADLLAEQIPAYWERDAFFESMGRRDLAAAHDYMVGKKLLELHSIGRRRGERADVRRLDAVIRGRYRPHFDEIYGCAAADPHHALRMRLFLIHPALYDAFTAVNEGIVLPLRRKRREGRRTMRRRAG